MWWILYCAMQAVPVLDPTAAPLPDDGILLPLAGVEEDRPAEPEGFYSARPTDDEPRRSQRDSDPTR
jgi:hypothetical protein